MSNALTVVSEITTAVSAQVRGYVAHGSLQLPANYSAENALKAAMLMLPEVRDMNKVPVLQSCTPESIKGALLSMVVQGLNPEKKQCYFIPYGERLTLCRSYFGDMAIAMRVDSRIEGIYAAVVYDKDEFEYGYEHGRMVVFKHIQKLENKGGTIKAAYATVLYRDGREVSTVKSWEQIKQAWKQSQTKPVNTDGTINPNSTHGKYPEEMARKTVIHAACKAIIDSSDDSDLAVRYARESDNDRDAAEADAEVKQNANKTFIDAEYRDASGDSPQCDPATGEVIEPESSAKGEEDPF